jgi:hypothetical protein
MKILRCNWICSRDAAADVFATPCFSRSKKYEKAGAAILDGYVARL